MLSQVPLWARKSSLRLLTRTEQGLRRCTGHDQSVAVQSLTRVANAQTFGHDLWIFEQTAECIP